jgi:hypothetical protein
MLRSYGIETAADVQQHRIQQVSGFGPVIAGSLVAWRTSIERRFVFKPNQPLNPADVAAVKAAILKERSEIEIKLRQSLTRLERASNDTRSVRNSVQAAAAQTWKARRQAELDLPRLAGFSVRTRLAGVGAAIFFTFMLLNAIESPSTIAQAARRTDPQPDIAVPINRKNEPRSETAPRDQSRRDLSSGAKVAEQKDATALATNTRTIEPQSPVTGGGMPNSSLLPTAPPPKEPPVAKTEPSVNPSPQNKPALQQLPPAIKQERTEASLDREATTREYMLRLQSRLRDLGFLSSPSLSGAWDASSRAALRDFKVVNRLSNDDVWDRRTLETLNSQTAIRANQSFVGTWCGGKKEPRLFINSRQAKSAVGGVCEFKAFEPAANEWRVRASCTDRNESWTSNISFTVRGNKLIWSGERGSTSYFRC